MAALSQCSTDAVGTGIAPANHNDPFAGSIDRRRALFVETLRAAGQVLHRKMDAGRCSAWNRQIARLGGPHRKHQCIVPIQYLFYRQIGGLIPPFLHEVNHMVCRHCGLGTNIGTVHKIDSSLAQQIDPALHQALVQLHHGNAIHQQPANAICPLVDRNSMTRAVQLISCRETCWPRSCHGDLKAGALPRNNGLYPSLFKPPINNRLLDILDGHCRLCDAEDTRSFTGCGAYPSGELRKIVGRVQTIERCAPFTLIHKVIPLRNQIVHGATLL